MNIQPTFASVRIGTRRFAFTTAAIVSNAYRAVIDELDLGASEAPNCELLDASGKRIGYVSYNGRVWSGDWDSDAAICVFDPREAA